MEVAAASGNVAVVRAFLEKADISEEDKRRAFEEAIIYLTSRERGEYRQIIELLTPTETKTE